ncbi:coiled-coil domain-containing protein 117 isoform X2 [Tiliqua scincoides]|uniref:coiled-coil domain-containing protein 117 isoform X2 n=1 Tax=Tiliqua scincoides TaxID=71010 RepID=UPI0034622AAC
MAALRGAFPGAAPASDLLPPGGPRLLGGGRPLPPAPPQRRPPRAPPGQRQKRRLQEAADGRPPSKRRLTAAPPVGVEDWGLSLAPPMGTLPGTPSTLEVPCYEEMEQAMGEPPCEAARREFQEIEDRIIDDDDDSDDSVLVEGSVGSLPTLVLSDTLKTGLKRDYEGDLTKKIVESINEQICFGLDQEAQGPWLASSG